MKMELWIAILIIIEGISVFGIALGYFKTDDFIIYLTTLLLCFPFSIVLAEALVFAFYKNKPWRPLK